MSTLRSVIIPLQGTRAYLRLVSSGGPRERRRGAVLAPRALACALVAPLGERAHSALRHLALRALLASVLTLAFGQACFLRQGRIGMRSASLATQPRCACPARQALSALFWPLRSRAPLRSAPRSPCVRYRVRQRRSECPTHPPFGDRGRIANLVGLLHMPYCNTASYFTKSCQIVRFAPSGRTYCRTAMVNNNTRS